MGQAEATRTIACHSTHSGIRALDPRAPMEAGDPCTILMRPQCHDRVRMGVDLAEISIRPKVPQPVSLLPD